MSSRKLLLSTMSEDGLKTLTVEMDEQTFEKTILLTGAGLPVEVSLSRRLSAQIGEALLYATIPWPGEPDGD